MRHLLSSVFNPMMAFMGLFTALTLTGCGDQQDADLGDNVLMIGTSADMPPFEFYKNRDIVGYDIDMIQAVAKKLGKTVRIQDMDFSALIPALQSNRIQVAVSSLTPNAERRQVVAFSKPYLTLPLAIVSMKSDDLSNLENLSEKILGVQLGSTHEQYANSLAQKDTSIKIKALNKLPELIEELKNGRVDGVVLETTTAISFQENNPNLKIYTLSDVDTSFSIALPLDSDLKEDIDQAIHDLRAEGVLDELRRKWFKGL